MTAKTTVAEYLIEQLRAHGVDHIFGVPGDFVLRFMDTMARCGIPLVGTCDEQGAGFAADGYARLRGMGAACITFSVGGLKIANSTAQAYAERSPVVVISGAPGAAEREAGLLLHHRVREFDTQKRVFEEITVASTVLDDPDTAPAEIDRVLAAAMRYKRPVYIEIPRDTVALRAGRHHVRRQAREQSDADTLRVAIDEAAGLLNAAKRPVILAGEEVHRFSLQDRFMDLVHRSNIPVATTILGKSVIDEDHPGFIGVYQGGIGRDEVRRYVEESDCVLMLGVMMTDMNLGVYTARLDRARCIHAVTEKLAIGHHAYEHVLFADFVGGLADSDLRRHAPGLAPAIAAPPPYLPDAGAAITVARLFARLNDYIGPDTVVVADPGDALFGAADLRVHKSCSFLAPAYYTSLGFSVPAAIGAQLARPHLRPLVLVGDGAFQMTGMELSTVARLGLNPIVIVLNNAGYVTERFIMDGAFNDIQPWDYSRIPDVIGAGRGFVVQTEGELETALAGALANTASFSIIDVRLDRMDATPTLRRLAGGLARRR